MIPPRDIDFLDTQNERVFMSDGEVLPITTRFDIIGEEIDSLKHAVSVVAGPDRNGRWWAVDLHMVQHKGRMQ